MIKEKYSIERMKSISLSITPRFSNLLNDVLCVGNFVSILNLGPDVLPFRSCLSNMLLSLSIKY